MQFLAITAQTTYCPIFGTYTVPPFKFQPRNRNMDWRRMSVLDVDRVARELDVTTLQENLTDITFCTLDQERCSHCWEPLDQALLNVLRLAQLIIEYLLHCQNCLTTRISQLEVRLQASLSQQERGQQELGCQAEELRGVREESHRRRKMIKDLQQLLQRSGGQSYYMCHLCEKTFMSASFLWNHLQRKHESEAKDEKKKPEQSMEEVVKDLRAQLTSTQEELAALLEKQQQLQEEKTTCKRGKDVKTMFEEWKEKLSEEIDQQKKVFWDELKSSIYNNSALEEKPTALQSQSAVGSALRSPQDGECRDQLRQTEELRALAVLKKMKIQDREWKRMFHELEKQLAANNRELQEENKKLQRQNEKLQTENKKLQKESKKLQKASKKLQKENEKLHDVLCQLHVTASQSQQHIMSLSTQMQQQARIITSQTEMTQTSSRRKVKGSCKGAKAVSTEEDSSKEEPEESQDEPPKVLKAQRQRTALQKMAGQTLGTTSRERGGSTGTNRDAKGIPMKSSRPFMTAGQEQREGKFSEWYSKASERAAHWFSGSTNQADQCW